MRRCAIELFWRAFQSETVEFCRGTTLMPSNAKHSKNRSSVKPSGAENLPAISKRHSDAGGRYGRSSPQSGLRLALAPISLGVGCPLGDCSTPYAPAPSIKAIFDNRAKPENCSFSHTLRKSRHAAKMKENWCPGWGSNPHDALASGDFKSPAYAIPPPGLCTNNRILMNELLTRLASRRVSRS